jgi:predicted DNA-binding protein
MVELQLETEAELLLEQFAARSGLTKAEYARRAVLTFLEDREDYEEAVQALKESEGQTGLTLAEVVESLGLESDFSHQSAEAIGEPGPNNAEADSQLPPRQTARVA